ncbi:hypothetical protein CT676_39080 [Bradyrhizobium sp. MOS001]|nr:hypothetical protein CT676_39080 [Bradyrhizobium sp. MOS001]
MTPHRLGLIVSSTGVGRRRCAAGRASRHTGFHRPTRGEVGWREKRSSAAPEPVVTGTAERLREQAKQLPHGPERETRFRKARQAETGSNMSDWLRSPSAAAAKLRQL